MRPLALSGIVFITSKTNIVKDGKRFGVELTALAKDLRSKYENEDLPFIYTQPTAELAPGITMPKIPNSTAVPLDKWMLDRHRRLQNEKALAEIAGQAAKRVK